MLLADLLKPEFIHLRAQVRSVSDLIRHLIEHFRKSSPASFDPQAAVSAVEQRNALGGIIFPTGLAVPHARLDNFEDLLIGICVPAEAIPMEDVPVRMIVLILTSRPATKIYLNTLAAFIKISGDADLFAKLLRVRSSHEFIQILRRAEITVKEGLTVGDVMTGDVTTITPQACLRELADLFYSRGMGYAAVVDGSGSFVGEIGVLDLLRAGQPQYTTMVRSLSFLETFAPLEKLMEVEDTLSVAEIMGQPPIRLEPQTSVVEAVYQLTRNQRDCLPVLQNGRVVGLLCAQEIVRRILRG